MTDEAVTSRWKLGVTTVFVCVAIVIGLVFVGYAIRENTQTHTALCEIRADMVRELASTERLLKQHPSGDIFGIPRELIEAGRDNDKQTIESLSILDCN